MAEAKMREICESDKPISIPSKEFIEIPLVHAQQKHNWDCGLSCIQMVLNDEMRRKYLEICESFLEELGCGQRVWTIDLVFILEHLGVDCKFCTITFGVDPAYETKMYYKHESFVAEQNRVDRLFNGVSERNVQVEKRSVTISEILQHLASNNPVVVLVNSNLLKCNHWMHSINELVHRLAIDELYTGHYIVLCGYDLREQSIIFRNPGYSDGVCKTTFDEFEIARKSHGTDEDIIFIWRQ